MEIDKEYFIKKEINTLNSQSTIASSTQSLKSSIKDSVNLTKSINYDGKIMYNFLDLILFNKSDNIYFPCEYIDEIYLNLLKEENETKFNLPENFIKGQKSINEKIRAILIDWLIEIQLHLKFRSSTLFLCVKIIDIYLSRKNIESNKFQLLGIAALLVSYKQEEILRPKLDEFIYMTDNSYTKEELVNMENDILHLLDFNIVLVNPLSFYQILSVVLSLDKKTYYFGKFFMESFLLDSRSNQISPSIIACSCAYIAMKFFNVNGYQICYDKKLNATHSSSSSIKDVAKEICFFIENLMKTELQHSFVKYSKPKYEEVALNICGK